MIDCCLYGFSPSGEFLVDNDLYGMVFAPPHSGPGLAGHIEVGGDFLALVYVGSERSLSGELTVHGNCDGMIVTRFGDMSGTVQIDGNLTGQILTFSADMSGDLLWAAI